MLAGPLGAPRVLLLRGSTHWRYCHGHRATSFGHGPLLCPTTYLLWQSALIIEGEHPGTQPRCCICSSGGCGPRTRGEGRQVAPSSPPPPHGEAHRVESARHQPSRGRCPGLQACRLCRRPSHTLHAGQRSPDCAGGATGMRLSTQLGLGMAPPPRTGTVARTCPAQRVAMERGMAPHPF